MSTPPTPRVPRTDPDAVLAALLRARKRAEEIAAATGTAIVQWEDGKLVYIYPGCNGEKRDASAPGSNDPGTA